MRTLASLALFAVLAMPTFARAAENELTKEEQDAGWQLLFNGTDHAGWKCNNGKKIATPVEDGALLPYKSGGYVIIHEKQFGDFVFKCEVKMTPPHCNSGIFFRIGDPKTPVYTGFEVQVYKGGTGMHDFGAIYDLVPASKNLLNGPGKWDTVEIKCQGPKVSVKVNGTEVAKMNCDEWPEKRLRPDGSKHKFGVAVKDLPRKGYLGFQDHGHKVWYKNVKILDLSKKK